MKFLRLIFLVYSVCTCTFALEIPFSENEIQAMVEQVTSLKAFEEQNRAEAKQVLEAMSAEITLLNQKQAALTNLDDMQKFLEFQTLHIAKQDVLIQAIFKLLPLNLSLHTKRYDQLHASSVIESLNREKMEEEIKTLKAEIKRLERK